MKFLIVMGLGRYTVGLEKGGKIVHGVELLVGELWELLLARSVSINSMFLSRTLG